MLHRAVAAIAVIAAVGCGRGEPRDVGLERTARRDVRPPDDSTTAAPNPAAAVAAESAAGAIPEGIRKRLPQSKPTTASTAADTAPLPAGTPPASAVAAVVSKLGLTVHPVKGQTKSQQARDERRCYTWAHSQTGIDPLAVAVNPDSASTAAGLKAKKEAEQPAEAAQQPHARVAQMTGTFAKAMSACLKGKGYTTQ